jgi:hypothetical protein
MAVKYKKGDRLIYPHHGACTVEKISSLSAFDVKQEYLTLRVTNSDLLLKVPVSKSDYATSLTTTRSRKSLRYCAKRTPARRPIGRDASRTTPKSFAPATFIKSPKWCATSPFATGNISCQTRKSKCSSTPATSWYPSSPSRSTSTSRRPKTG